jgi:peptidoglycan hydrolase CwlO-like protein
MENLKNLVTNKTNIVLILMGVLVCMQLFNLIGNNNESSKVNYIEEEISKIRQDINKLHNEEKSLDKKIDSFNFNIKKIKKEVNVNNEKIEKLKKDEKNQTDKFKYYDANMWERYFADRYHEK